MENRGPACRVFVRFDHEPNPEKRALRGSLADIVMSSTGAKEPAFTVVSEYLQVDIERNKFGDPSQAAQGSFVDFADMLWIEPASPETQRNDFRGAVRQLVRDLRRANATVVVAVHRDDEFEIEMERGNVTPTQP